MPDHAPPRTLRECRWLGTMRSRPSWATVNEVFYADFAAPFKEASFVWL